jgi:hypothetical protein
MKETKEVRDMLDKVDKEEDYIGEQTGQSGGSNKIDVNSNMDIEDVMPWDESNQMVVHKVVPS